MIMQYFTLRKYGLYDLIGGVNVRSIAQKEIITVKPKDNFNSCHFPDNKRVGGVAV